MKRVIVPIANGFEEIETTTVVDVLRRAKVQVVLAGIEPGALTGSRHIQVVPDKELAEVLDQDFDMIVLPGGQPGVNHLLADKRVEGVISKMAQEQKWVAAICAAPLLLKQGNLISGKKITSHPSVESELTDADYQTTRVVQDGKLITSRSPGTAMEFALHLVELLVGPKKREEIRQAVLHEDVAHGQV